MAGFFVLLLFILLGQYWYLAVAGVVLFVLWCCAQARMQRVAKERHERELHEHARRRIDAVAAASARAMVQAARRRS